MKTQHKILIIFGLFILLSTNIFSQIQKNNSNVITQDSVVVINETGFAASSSNSDLIPAGDFNIGEHGAGFVAMPSPNSLTIVNQIEAGADLYTGKVKSSVPITALTSYDITVPITLNYASNGIKVNDIGSWVGTGWDLNAGGKITRVMRNLPDEFSGMLSHDDLGRLWKDEVGLFTIPIDIPGYGYLNIKTDPELDGNSFPVDLNQLNFSNYLPTYNTPAEIEKRQKVIQLADWQSCEDCEIALDTEPDEFYFNFGNYSGKFVFDQDGGIHTIPHSNLIITPHIENVAANLGDKSITSFEVKTPEGMIYTFGSIGTSLDAVETSLVYQTSMSNRYQYDYLGECNEVESTQNGNNIIPCETVTHHYKLNPRMGIKGWNEGYSHLNDFTVNLVDESSNENAPQIKNHVSKRLGYFSSTWHLKSISSPSGDLVTFGYTDEFYRYAQSRGYNWVQPDLPVEAYYEMKEGSIQPQGQFALESSLEPIEAGILQEPDLIYPSLATLTYSVTEVAINGKRLASINTSTNKSLEFVPTSEDRADLFGAKRLDIIEFKIGGIKKKSWSMDYNDVTLLNEDVPQWQTTPDGLLKLTTEDALDIRFGDLASGLRYMSSFRDYCWIKHRYWKLWDENNSTGTPIDLYYEQEYQKVWKPEHNRFYLNRITENGRNSESIDLVDFDYYTNTPLPKRFSYKQDKFGFFNNNTRSTLLPSKLTSVQSGFGDRYLPFEDIQTAEEEFLGHIDNTNWVMARNGILRRMKFHTGARKTFYYRDNIYGVNLKQITVDPAGSPIYKEIYNYYNSIYVMQGNNLDPTDGHALKKYTGVPMNYADNQFVMGSYPFRPLQMTKGSLKGFGKVKKTIKDNSNNDIGYTEYFFYTPNDFSNEAPTMRWVFDVNDAILDPADYSYPYAPFKDVDYKRGIPKNTVVKNKQGLKVSETIYNWDFSSSSGSYTVDGLKTATIQRFEEDPDLNWIAHRADYYRILSDRYKLLSTTQRSYENGDETNSIDITTTYTHNSQTNDVTTQTFENSNGDVHLTEYIRAYDGLILNDPAYQSCVNDYNTCLAQNGCSGFYICEPCSSDFQTCLNSGVTGSVGVDMLQRNMGSTVIETRQLINGTQIGGSKVNFKSDWSNCFGCVLPWETYNYQDGWELKSTTIDVNSNGQPLEIQRAHYSDPIFFTWTSDGLLAQKNYSDWTWNYLYDAERMLQSFTDVDLQTTTYTYDGFGKLSLISERGGVRETEIDYVYAGLNNTGENTVTTEITTGNIPPTKETFDGLGRSLRIAQIGHTEAGTDYIVSQQYDAFGRVKRTSNPAGGTPTYFYYEDSPKGRAVEQWSLGAPSSVHTKYELNVDGEVPPYTGNTLYKTTIFDENGYPNTTFTDKLGRTILIRKKVDGQNVDTHYLYDSRGRLERITQPNGEEFTYTYYDDGLLHTKSIPGGGTTTYTYNDKDQILTETDAVGNILEYTYNEYDQPLEVTLDGNVIISNTYYDNNSEQGNKGRLKATIANGLNVSGSFANSFFYDAYGRLQSESRQHPIANDDYTYVYDDQRDLTELITRNHHSPNGTIDIIKDFGYDHGGRLKFQDFTYGNLTTKKIFELNYDNSDRLIEKNLGVSQSGVLQSVDYEYNIRGWLKKINDVGDCSGGIDQAPNGGGVTPAVVDLSPFQQSGDITLLYNANDIQSNNKTNIQFNYSMDIVQDGNAAYQVTDNADINIGGAVDPNSINYTHNREYLVDGEIDDEAMAMIMTNDIISDANTQLATASVTEDREEEIRTKLQFRIRNNPKGEDCQNKEGDLFAQELYYNTTPSIPGVNLEKQYNGNISSMKWRVMVPGRDYVNHYGFNYDGVFDPSNAGLDSSNDGLNQLKGAHYAQRTLGNSPSWVNEGRYDVNITYNDHAGNIGSILRNGVTGGTSGNLTYGVTDELNFTYKGSNKSQLDFIKEAGNIDHGFNKDFKVYQYDANGNIKKIVAPGAATTISNNHLNLPEVISTADGDITYTYDGTGRKLSKQVTGEDERSYVDGIEYLGNNIEAIYHEEGRLLIEDGKHEYVLRDHLGNSRIMFKDVDGLNGIDPDPIAEEVIQENHYYPFGMHLEGDWLEPIDPFSNYLYNGKEYIPEFDLNWSDYGARIYDGGIGKWNSVDPLAESYPSSSSNAYVLNNPIKLIDPDGRFSMSFNPVLGTDGSLLGHDSEGWGGVPIVWTGDTRYFYNGIDHNILLSSGVGVSLNKYLDGIYINDDVWNTIEKEYYKSNYLPYQRMKPYVSNLSNYDAWILPEDVSNPMTILKPGLDYYPRADGISTYETRSNGRVAKLGNFASVTILNDGFLPNNQYSIYASGMENESYLKDLYWDSDLWVRYPSMVLGAENPWYNHWARLFGGHGNMIVNTYVPNDFFKGYK